jgi:hypothetical protein
MEKAVNESQRRGGKEGTPGGLLSHSHSHPLLTNWERREESEMWRNYIRK